MFYNRFSVYLHREVSLTYFTGGFIMNEISINNENKDVISTVNTNVSERHPCFIKLFEEFNTLSKTPNHFTVGPIYPLITECLNIDITDTVVLLFHLRDRGENLGCREAFITLFSYVLNRLAYLHFQDTGINSAYDNEGNAWEILFKAIPNYGRWDDLINIGYYLHSDIQVDILIWVLLKQLDTDMFYVNTNNEISMLGKWLPSINASSKVTRAKAKWLIAIFNHRIRISDHNAFPNLPKAFTCESYRKMCVALRNRIDIAEHHLTTKKYKNINYKKMPALAYKKYQKALYKHDKQRITNYRRVSIRYPDRVRNAIDAVKRSTILRFDAVNNKIKRKLDNVWNHYAGCYSTNRLVCADCSKDIIVNKLNYRTIDIARTIILRSSENNASSYYNGKILIKARKGIEFRSIDDCKTIKAKLNAVSMSKPFDIKEVYTALEIIASNAHFHNVKPEDIPTEFVIITDSDPKCILNDKTVLSQKKYSDVETVFTKYGYTIPKIIIWDLCSDEIEPDYYTDLGITVIKGVDMHTIIAATIEKEIPDYFKLDMILSSPRYDFVQKAFENATYVDHI